MSKSVFTLYIVSKVPLSVLFEVLSGDLVFPKFFDKNAKVLVKKLLTSDLGKRYGNINPRNLVDDGLNSFYDAA